MLSSIGDATFLSPFPEDICFSAIVLNGVEDIENFSLHPSEASALSERAIASRRRQFTMGRAAARSALGSLGLFDTAVPRAHNGRPLWPKHVVGSISHTNDVAIAAVGYSKNYAGIGIDIEHLDRQTSSDISKKVCRPSELTWIQGDHRHWRLRAIFCAKEAIFKATFPIEEIFLGFQDAELTWDGTATFNARLLKHVGAGYPVGTVLRVGIVQVASYLLAHTSMGARHKP